MRSAITTFTPTALCATSGATRDGSPRCRCPLSPTPSSQLPRTSRQGSGWGVEGEGAKHGDGGAAAAAFPKVVGSAVSLLLLLQGSRRGMAAPRARCIYWSSNGLPELPPACCTLNPAGTTVRTQVRLWDLRVNGCQALLQAPGLPTTVFDEQVGTQLELAPFCHGSFISWLDSRARWSSRAARRSWLVRSVFNRGGEPPLLMTHRAWCLRWAQNAAL